jgi:hypothetical protein
MLMLRRTEQWLAWGSFGPLVFLLGSASLYMALRLRQSDPDEFQDPFLVAAALLGGIAAVVGAQLILRPTTNFRWALVFALSMCAANVGWDLSEYGLTQSEIQDVALWVIEAGLVVFYAYHCHVPGYRWGAPLSADAPGHRPEPVSHSRDEHVAR